jgi:hypothetical protein
MRGREFAVAIAGAAALDGQVGRAKSGVDDPKLTTADRFCCAAQRGIPMW